MASNLSFDFKFHVGNFLRVYTVVRFRERVAGSTVLPIIPYRVDVLNPGFNERAMVRLDGGGVILEIFMVGWSKPFYGGGMVGGKKFVDHFFPFYKILADFSVIFIILSPHRKPFKIFMMGVPEHCRIETTVITVLPCQGLSRCTYVWRLGHDLKPQYGILIREGNFSTCLLVCEIS